MRGGIIPLLTECFKAPYSLHIVQFVGFYVNHHLLKKILFFDEVEPYANLQMAHFSYAFSGRLGPFHSLAIVTIVAKSMDVKGPLQQGNIFWVHALKW